MKILINKFLSQTNIGSRRKIDNLIKTNQIIINSHSAQVGQVIDTSTDKVFYNNKRLEMTPNKIYLAFNKPLNVLSSVSDNRGRKTILDYIDIKDRIYPIGRLDYNSTGLILLTNDGNLALRLTHPRYHIPKKYLVVVDKKITDNFTRNMSEARMVIENQKLSPAHIVKLNKNTFEITLYQGIKRQIRQMCRYLGYEVISLHRVQIGDIKLDDLKEGKFRYLTDTELKNLIS